MFEFQTDQADGQWAWLDVTEGTMDDGFYELVWVDGIHTCDFVE